MSLRLAILVWPSRHEFDPRGPDVDLQGQAGIEWMNPCIGWAKVMKRCCSCCLAFCFKRTSSHPLVHHPFFPINNAIDWGVIFRHTHAGKWLPLPAVIEAGRGWTLFWRKKTHVTFPYKLQAIPKRSTMEVFGHFLEFALVDGPSSSMINPVFQQRKQRQRWFSSSQSGAISGHGFVHRIRTSWSACWGPRRGCTSPERILGDDEVLIVNDTNLWQLGYIILYGYIIYYYGYMMLCKWIQQPFSDPSPIEWWRVPVAVFQGCDFSIVSHAAAPFHGLSGDGTCVGHPSPSSGQQGGQQAFFFAEYRQNIYRNHQKSKIIQGNFWFEHCRFDKFDR